MAGFNLKHALAGVLVCCMLAGPGAADAATRPPTGRPLKLALFFVQENGPAGWEGLEDLFLVQISSQPRLQLVDRSLLKRVLKEQALTLGGLADKKNAVTVGRIAGADFLLFVKVLAKAVAVRLVEVASGKVRLEDRLAVGKDPHLTAAAVREMVLKSLKLQADIKDRLTVGITAFPNRSGTDRSDKLGLALQKAIRKRLREEPWGTVLERQYPTSLLDEVELTRFGLAKGPAEKLPPADVVVLGAMQDVSKEYAADKPWRVKLDLTVRLGKRSARFDVVCGSDDLDKAADRIVRHIDAVRRRQAAGESAESEVRLWRRHALYLMPRSAYSVGRGPHECYGRRERLDTFEMIRAWENVLLLEADDAEAKMNLAVCLVSLSQYVLRPSARSMVSPSEKRAACRQCDRASQLAESALRAQPTRDNAATFCRCIPPARHLPERAAEMLDMIVANPGGVFEKWQVDNARQSLALVRKDGIFPELERVVKNVRQRPKGIWLAWQLTRGERYSPQHVVKFAGRFTDHPHPLVRFVFECVIADTLWRRRSDPTALDHYDRAIRVHEAACAAAGGSDAGMIDDVYRHRLSACKFLSREKEAKESALAGARHFMKVRRFNHSIGWLYFYCATELLGPREETQALEICQAYLDAVKRHPNVQDSYGPRMLEKREQLEARIAGRPVATFDDLRLIRGTATTGLKSPRMAVGGGKLWLAWQHWQSGGPALMVDLEKESASPVPDLPKTIRSVAAAGKWVYFGGHGGVYKLNTEGKLIKHFSTADGSLPVNHVVDLCSGGGKIYFSFRDSDSYGVAALDPTTDVVSVLAPSRRGAKLADEPVYQVYRVWWDAACRRLYVSYYLRFAVTSDRTRQFGWIQEGKKWLKLHNRNAPRMIVSQGAEAVVVMIPNEETEFRFLKTEQRVKAKVPLPWLMGEPAWDDRRIWVPTFTGLYEIDRATGELTWLAHRQNTPCLSLLRHGKKLYVATAGGLYSYPIPQRRPATMPAAATGTATHPVASYPGVRGPTAVAADGLYATKDFFGQLPAQVAAVSRLRKNAALRELLPPDPPRRAGRRRLRGPRLPSLQELTAQANHWKPVVLRKQGRKVRRRIHGLTCQWYHVCRCQPVRVVMVQDPSGQEDDLHVVCTDASIPDAAIVQRYFDRWGIEECIQEAKQHMGMERTRGWCQKTVSRQAPLAMILATLAKLWFVKHGSADPSLLPPRLPWYAHKRSLSFRDMLGALRLAFWRHRLLDNLHSPRESDKFMNALTYALCQAA